MDRRWDLAASLTLFFSGTGTYRPRNAEVLVSVKTGAIGSAVNVSVSGVVGSVVIMVVLVRSCDYCICFNSLQIFFCRKRRFIFGLAEIPVLVSEKVKQERSPIQVGEVAVIGCVFHLVFRIEILLLHWFVV